MGFDPHRDPFDRGLIAQAIVEGMTLVTPDPVIVRYPVPILWQCDPAMPAAVVLGVS